MPRPVEYGTGARRGVVVTELRGGEESAADGDEAVRRRGAGLVPEELVAGGKVPGADSGVDGG